MLCVPRANVDVVNAADPLDVVDVPMETPPSENVTVSPFGAAPDCIEILAVNVTEAPNSTEFQDEELEEIAVVVVCLLTVCVSELEALDTLFVSPG